MSDKSPEEQKKDHDEWMKAFDEREKTSEKRKAELDKLADRLARGDTKVTTKEKDPLVEAQAAADLREKFANLDIGEMLYGNSPEADRFRADMLPETLDSMCKEYREDVASKYGVEPQYMQTWRDVQALRNLNESIAKTGGE